MARSERHDADYFPFYCKDGKTLFVLESKYQCKGTGFFTNVLRFLTIQPDHYICIKDDVDRLHFFARAKCDEESGIDMLNLMARTGKIDNKLWVTAGVIVSQDLLNSLQDAYRRRNNPIITLSQIYQTYNINKITDGKIPISPGDTSGNEITDGSNPQRKGKERKGKNKLCVYSDAFLSFWSSYPKKAGKKAAYAEWEKATGKPPLEDILSALEKQKRAKKTLADTGQFVAEWPDPERWIKKARWEDDPSTYGGTNGASRASNKPGGIYSRRDTRPGQPAELPADVLKTIDQVNASVAASRGDEQNTP